MKDDKGKGIWLQSLGNFQWSIKFNGRVIGEAHYDDLRDYILGKRPRAELLERFGVTDDKQQAQG